MFMDSNFYSKKRVNLNVHLSTRHKMQLTVHHFLLYVYVKLLWIGKILVTSWWVCSLQLPRKIIICLVMFTISNHLAKLCWKINVLNRIMFLREKTGLQYHSEKSVENLDVSFAIIMASGDIKEHGYWNCQPTQRQNSFKAR